MNRYWQVLEKCKVVLMASKTPAKEEKDIKEHFHKQKRI